MFIVRFWVPGEDLWDLECRWWITLVESTWMWLKRFRLCWCMRQCRYLDFCRFISLMDAARMPLCDLWHWQIIVILFALTLFCIFVYCELWPVWFSLTKTKTVKNEKITNSLTKTKTKTKKWWKLKRENRKRLKTTTKKLKTKTKRKCQNSKTSHSTKVLAYNMALTGVTAVRRWIRD